MPHTHQGQLSQGQAQHQFLQRDARQPDQPSMLPQAPRPQHQPPTSGFPAALPSSFPQHHCHPSHSLSSSSATSHTTATAQHQRNLYLTVPAGIVPRAPPGYALVPLVGHQGCPAPQLVPPPGFALVPVASDGSLLHSGAILPPGQQQAPPTMVPQAPSSNSVLASADARTRPSLSNMAAAAQLRSRLAATQPMGARGDATALAQSADSAEATSGADPSGPSAADVGGGCGHPPAQSAAKRKAWEPPEALPEQSSAGPCKRLRAAPNGSSMARRSRLLPWARPVLCSSSSTAAAARRGSVLSSCSNRPGQIRDGLTSTAEQSHWLPCSGQGQGLAALTLAPHLRRRLLDRLLDSSPLLPCSRRPP